MRKTREVWWGRGLAGEGRFGRERNQKLLNQVSELWVGGGGRGRRGSRFRILIRVNAGYKESLTSPATILPRSINAFQRFHNSVLITEKRIHLDFKTIQFPSILSTYRSTSFVRDNSSFLRGHFIIRSFSGFHYSNGGKCNWSTFGGQNCNFWIRWWTKASKDSMRVGDNTGYCNFKVRLRVGLVDVHGKSNF